MNCFWDSSAVINAAVSPAVYRRLQQDDHFARLHVLLETFSTLTGRGIKQNDTQGNPVVIRFDSLLPSFLESRQSSKVCGVFPRRRCGTVR